MSKLDDILADYNLPPEISATAKRVKSLEDKVANAGYDPGETEPRESLFGQALDILDSPRQGVAGLVNTLLRGDAFTTDEEGNNVGLGIMRGMKENTTASDIFREHDIIDDPTARGIAGFAADMLTDPFTYLATPFAAARGGVVGGKALTEAGEAAAHLASQRIAEKFAGDVTKAIDSDDILNTTFRLSGQIADLRSQAAKIKNVDTKNAILEEIASKEKSLESLGGFLKPDEISSELFQKKSLSLGLNVPFLGNFQKESKLKSSLVSTAGENIDPITNPIYSLLNKASKAWKPGRVDLLNITADSPIGRLAISANDFAKTQISNLATGIAETVPLAGKVGRAINKEMKVLSDGFKSVFNRKALIGASAADNIRMLESVKRGNKRKAFNVIENTFTPEELSNSVAHTNVLTAIDKAIEDTTNILGLNESQELKQVYENIMARGTMHEDDMIKIQNLYGDKGEEIFQKAVLDRLSTPGLDKETQSIGIKSLQMMKDLYQEERAAGLRNNFFSIYLPRMYENAAKAPIKSGVSRQFKTAAEALKQRGLVSRVDLPNMLLERLHSSYNVRSNQDFFYRLALENGMEPQVVQRLVKLAEADPNGEAARFLKSNRIPVEAPDQEILQAGKRQFERDAAFDAARMGDADAAEAIPASIQDFDEMIHKKSFAEGIKPLDVESPQVWRSELGKEITLKDGRKMILPTPIAKAWDDALAAKDMLKSRVQEGGIFSKFIDGMDYASSMFRTMTTRPFIAYYTQNLLGDAYFNAMQGVQNFDPGLPARLWAVMQGKAALKTKYGNYIDKATLERIINEIEPGFKLSNMQDLWDTFGKLDVDKMKSYHQPIYENFKDAGKSLMDGKVMTASQRAMYGAMQMNDRFIQQFAPNFRIKNLFARLEAGDSIGEAVKHTRNAFLDYGNLSPVERDIFRRMYMFYGFASQATKHTLTQLISNPGNITGQIHAINGMAEFFSDPDAAPTFAQQDAKLLGSMVSNEQISRVIGKGGDGSSIIARGFAAPLNAVLQQFSLEAPRSLAVSEVLDAVSDSTTRTIQKQFAMANPVINAAAQKISGKNLYFDRPLDAEFLRKLPSLNAIAERLTGLSYDQLPIDLDAPAKEFLGAIPDGKGRLIATKPGRFWLLMNVIPGLSRATSMAGQVANADIPAQASLLRFLTGVNLDDGDPSRGYLAQRRDELDKFIREKSIDRQRKNEKEGIE